MTAVALGIADRMSIAAPSYEKSAGSLKALEHQGQCPKSDTVDFGQCDLAVSVASFIRYR
jgi:hypothetical protein